MEEYKMSNGKICPKCHYQRKPDDDDFYPEYECPKCNVDIKIYVGTKTFLKTTPIEGDPFEKHNFVTNQDYE